MILGVDVGYDGTKVYSNGNLDYFKSCIQEDIIDINDSIQIEYEGKSYTVGDGGLVSTDLNKIDDITFKLCLYTAIGRNIKVNGECIELVTGLPIQYYKEQKNELRESLEGKTINITINGEPKRFTIVRCIVFPQSAGLFLFKKFTGDNCVIDIGGKTVDVSYFQDTKLKSFRTYELGILKLYDSLIQDIKGEHKVSYDVLRAEYILKTKEIMQNDKTVLIPDTINKTLKKHTAKILNKIKNGMEEYSISKKHFIGGGSYILKDFLPGEVQREDIFANAKSFYMIGVEKFEN